MIHVVVDVSDVSTSTTVVVGGVAIAVVVMCVYIV